MGMTEFLLDVLRLTDEVKRINEVQTRLQANITDIDKRVVRLETMVEITQPKAIT